MPDTYIDHIGHNKTVHFEHYETDEEGIRLLLQLMEKEPLAPWLEDTMGYIPTWLNPDSDHAKERAGVKSYCGNFHRLACSFRLDTRDAHLIAKLDAAIQKNFSTPDYQAAKAEWIEHKRKKEERIRQRRQRND